MRKILLDVNASVIMPTAVSDLYDTDEDASELRYEQIYATLIDKHIDLYVTDDLQMYEKLKNTGVPIHYLTEQ